MSKETSDTSSTTSTPKTTTPLVALSRSARRALLNELPPELRQLHLDVLRHTLADGIPVQPAALVVVLSAHDELVDIPLTFSADHVGELLWFAIAEFCEDFGLEIPNGCREALHAVLAIGVALDALHPMSDPPAALFGAFRQLAVAN